VESFRIEYEDGFQRAWAQIDGTRTRILNFERDEPDARELCRDLANALKKPMLTVLNGRRCFLRVRAEGDAFEVAIEEAPPLDPASPPKFTLKQGQYLAYLYNYTKMHGQAPAESDLQYYFRVSPPAVHDMIKILERNGFIERTPGVARSIRLLVAHKYLPHLE
jgi:DNA-binding MarR family transcriptional regulator